MNKLKFENLVLNYYPGAVGDMLMSALLETDAKLNDVNRTNLPSIHYKMKFIEKFFIEESRKQDPATQWDSADKDSICDALLHEEHKFPQSCHYICCLEKHHIARLAQRYKIYQIMVEPKHYRLVEFFKTLKTSYAVYNNIDELKQGLKLSQDVKTIKRIHMYHTMAQGNLDVLIPLSFDRLFFEPFEDFTMLYKELRGKEPNMEKFKKKIDQSINLPKYMNIFGQDVEIDIENFTINKV